MLKSTRRNSGKVRNRMHPNEARMQEDYYSSAAIIANQQEESEMAALSINAPKSKEEITMNEQAQQDQTTPSVEVTVAETVTKPSTRRALPARQAKQQETTDVADTMKAIKLTPEEEAIVVNDVLDRVQDDLPDIDVRKLYSQAQETRDQFVPDVDLVLEPTTLDESEVPVVPEVRKRAIPGARPSMLPPKVEPSVKVEPTVTVAPKGYVDAGDRYERKVEASLLGVTASVTMTKPKPSSAGLIFEGRIDLEEAEGVQFWRPIFNRKVTPDDHVPAHCVPVIVRAAQYRNAGLFDPVFLIAIPCTVGDMNDPNVEVSSGEDGTVITFKTE